MSKNLLFNIKFAVTLIMCTQFILLLSFYLMVLNIVWSNEIVNTNLIRNESFITICHIVGSNFSI